MPHTIAFLPHNKKITVHDGESLIRAAMEAGVHINASCGGGGVCGKCRVKIESGAVDGGVSEQLSDTDREKGYCLACLATVKSDLTVRIPVESEVETSRLTQTMDRHTARAMSIDLEDLKQDGL
ncbi:MAG TPA: 2Fe-2S iron-sulfur cluster binding domain-containing protein, partial [Desulfotignum sp.]|nr:2Fe-2S iron-sulfur cluster binding domain-containing protein [Desulfotignum sp.]